MKKLSIKAEKKIKNKKIKIDNSLAGLYHFLTSPNLRNKTKHPLFLAMKFSNIFKIYINPTIFSKSVIYKIK